MHKRRKFWRYFNSRFCTCGLLWPCVEREIAAARALWQRPQPPAWNAKTPELMSPVASAAHTGAPVGSAGNKKYRYRA
jgi:hypothetical protein